MRRRLLMAKASGFVVAVGCSSAWAQIFKCPDGGSFVLQQSPCPGLGAGGGRLVTFANGRPAPTPPGTGAIEAPKSGRVLGRSRLPPPTAVQNRK